jgi:hypothetical protein
MTSYTTLLTPLQSAGCNHCGQLRATPLAGEFSTASGGKANSLTPLPALFLPKDDAHAPNDIPETTIGIVDTIRWRLDLRPLRHARYGGRLDADLADLTPARGWRRVRVPDRYWQTEVARFLRSRDGARIIVYKSSVAAEVSPARHAGFSNDEQHRLSPYELLDFLRELELELFPRTTRACAVSRVRQEWHLVRLDLAINFLASMSAIIETYRDARHPRIRPLPEVYSRHGIAWLGKRYQLVIYNTETRPSRSKLLSIIDTAQLGTGIKDLVRAEFRFRGREAMRTFVRVLRAAEEIPLRGMTQCLRHDRGGWKERANVAWTRFTNNGLHRVLASELAALEGGVRPLPPVTSKNAVHGYGLVFLALVPQTWSVIESHYSERQARGIARQLTGIRVRTSNTRLVDLAWTQPRFLVEPDAPRPRAQHHRVS